MSDLDHSAVFTQRFLLQAWGGGSENHLYHINNIINRVPQDRVMEKTDPAGKERRIRLYLKCSKFKQKGQNLLLLCISLAEMLSHT